MRHPRRSLSLLLVALAAAVLVAGCDGGGAATPPPSADPSASPIIATDPDFCAALDVFESEHRILRDITLRSNTRRALNDQFEQLGIAWDDVQAYAPRGLRDQLHAMDWVVIDLGLAVEDFTTTDNLGEAADHVVKMDTAFDKALARLRARTPCAPWEPTPEADRSPTPAPSDTRETPLTPAPGGSRGDTSSPSAPVPSTTPRPIGR